MNIVSNNVHKNQSINRSWEQYNKISIKITSKFGYNQGNEPKNLYNYKL